MFFYNSLFHKQVPDDENQRILVRENYFFTNFFMDLVSEVAESPANSRFDKFCEGAHPEYSGDSPCAYNIAVALSETKVFLETQISKNKDDWLWRNVHMNEYPNMPWSKTPLRLLFHREVPIGGNSNTPNVSKYSIKRAHETNKFIGVHSANYKQIIDMSTEREGKYSIDTGNDANIFSPHYFTMNKDHLSGKLQSMLVGGNV